MVEPGAGGHRLLRVKYTLVLRVMEGAVGARSVGGARRFAVAAIAVFPLGL